MKNAALPGFLLMPAAIHPVTPDCPVEVFRWGGPSDHHADEKPHAHPFDEILLFNKGGGHHWINGTSYEVKDSSLHFVRVGCRHQLSRAMEAEGGTVLFLRDYIALEPGIPFKQLFFLESSPVLQLTDAAFADLWWIYKQLLQEARSDLNFYRKQCILSWLNALLVKVAGHYRHHFPETAIPSGTPQPSRLANAFLELVQTHFRVEKTVDFYARQLYITPKYLYEICRKQLGKSPQDIIADCLQTEAVRLLQDADHPVKTIADQLGFPDPAYFSRFLKKRSGKSPVAWRAVAQ